MPIENIVTERIGKASGERHHLSEEYLGQIAWGEHVSGQRLSYLGEDIGSIFVGEPMMLKQDAERTKILGGNDP